MKRTIDRWLPRYRRFEAVMARQFVNDGRILLALSRRTLADFQETTRPPHVLLPTYHTPAFQAVKCHPCDNCRGRVLFLGDQAGPS